MNRDGFVEDNLREMAYSWWGITLILGIFLFLVLGVMDYFVTPENFQRFFFLRTGISIALLCGYLLNRWMAFRRVSRRWHTVVLIFSTALAAATIEVMVLQLGGHSSYYYAGLILLAVCVLGLNPLGTLPSAIVVGVIYVIYLVPILLLDTIVNVTMFVSENFFLACTFVIALVWRHLAHDKLVAMLHLQWQTKRDKEKLQVFSEKLELLVDERTRDLRKSEELQRALYENANDIILIMDGSGMIIDVNRKACEVYGFDKETLVGANVSILEANTMVVESKRRLRRIVTEGSMIYETTHLRRDGSRVELEVSAKKLDIDGKVLIQSFYRDVTEKKQFQKQLLHSQKMDSVGQLAGGISHELNNILASMLGQAEIVLMGDGLDADVERRLHLIERAGRQGAQIVSKLLSFSRKKSFEAAAFRMNDLIVDTLSVVSGLLPDSVTVARKLREPLPAVTGDVSQIDQVLMNLLVNARDAMPEGGEITVRTDTVELTGRSIDVGADVVPGLYVVLEVSDTGTGIPDEYLSRIFEPFFTTKEEGRGTGLGLAMVYGIVKDHQGYVTVSSEEGLGTTFRVYVPAARRTEPAVPKQPRTSRGKGEFIVLVEDDQAILESVSVTLEKSGYRVLCAQNTEEAQRVLEARGDQIALLISDFGLGRDSGLDLIRQARTRWPGMGAVLMTGNAALAIPSEDMTSTVLVKPFTRERLLTAVSQTLQTVRGQ